MSGFSTRLTGLPASKTVRLYHNTLFLFWEFTFKLMVSHCLLQCLQYKSKPVWLITLLLLYNNRCIVLYVLDIRTSFFTELNGWWCLLLVKLSRFWELLTSQYYAEDGLECREGKLRWMVCLCRPVLVSICREQLWVSICVITTPSIFLYD